MCKPKMPLYKLTKVSMGDVFPGNSSEDDFRDWLKHGRQRWCIAEIVGCDVGDIKKVERKISCDGSRKEGDLLVWMKDGKKIYIELVRKNLDMDHFGRTQAYALKLKVDMAILVGESIDEGWFNEQKTIFNALSESLNINLGMRVVEFFEKGGMNVMNVHGQPFTQYKKPNTPKHRTNILSIEDLFKKNMRVISRKYKNEYYEGKIVDANNIQYKGKKYSSYDQFYKAVTPNTNSHYEGEGMWVKNGSNEWTKLLDI